MTFEHIIITLMTVRPFRTVCLAMAANVAATAIATNVLLISIDGMHQSDLE